MVLMVLGLVGCGDSPVFIYTEIETFTDSERARVRIDRSMTKDDAEVLMQRLQKLTGAKERVVTLMAEPMETTWFDLAPVTNIQSLADLIDFGTVKTITGRVIIVSMPEK